MGKRFLSGNDSGELSLNNHCMIFARRNFLVKNMILFIGNIVTAKTISAVFTIITKCTPSTVTTIATINTVLATIAKIAITATVTRYRLNTIITLQTKTTLTTVRAITTVKTRTISRINLQLESLNLFFKRFHILVPRFFKSDSPT